MILIANTDRSGSLETPDSETQHKGIRSATRVPRLVRKTRESLHPAQCPHTAAHQVEIRMRGMGDHSAQNYSIRRFLNYISLHRERNH